MSMWPEKFVILRDGFSEGLPDRVIKSQMDVGPAKKRRRTILASYNIAFTCRIESFDVDEFKTFYLDNDVLPFDFKHPRTNKIVKARFNNVPEIKLNELSYTANVELEILP